MYHCYGICLDCKSVIFNVLTTINVFFFVELWQIADVVFLLVCPGNWTLFNSKLKIHCSFF